MRNIIGTSDFTAKHDPNFRTNTRDSKFKRSDSAEDKTQTYYFCCRANLDGIDMAQTGRSRGASRQLERQL